MPLQVHTHALGSRLECLNHADIIVGLRGAPLRVPGSAALKILGQPCHGRPDTGSPLPRRTPRTASAAEPGLLGGLVVERQAAYPNPNPTAPRLYGACRPKACPGELCSPWRTESPPYLCRLKACVTFDRAYCVSVAGAKCPTAARSDTWLTACPTSGLCRRGNTRNPQRVAQPRAAES
jgi:hypothetical protein